MAAGQQKWAGLVYYITQPQWGEGSGLKCYRTMWEWTGKSFKCFSSPFLVHCGGTEAVQTTTPCGLLPVLVGRVRTSFLWTTRWPGSPRIFIHDTVHPIPRQEWCRALNLWCHLVSMSRVQIGKWWSTHFISVVLCPSVCLCKHRSPTQASHTWCLRALWLLPILLLMLAEIFRKWVEPL